ncbi:MAG: DUF305 domain-containing protein [Acidobacteriota bacterium]|nr:DUF305 domain-containing protein [Acidobacteriota bacterium]
MTAVVAMSCKQQTVPTKVRLLSAAERYDLRFIDTATVHQQYSIEMARAAQRKITHPALMAMMMRMIDGKTAERRQLAVWRAAWYGPRQRKVYDANLPGALSMKMDMSLPTGEAGDAWDAAFVDEMIPHMAAMIEMASDAARRASHPELRSFAARMIPVLQEDVSTMRSWQREWRGTQTDAPWNPATRSVGRPRGRA